jgi:hypothetical protein
MQARYIATSVFSAPWRGSVAGAVPRRSRLVREVWNTVSFDVIVVQLSPETRPLAQPELTVLARRAIGNELAPNRVAIRVKHSG